MAWRLRGGRALEPPPLFYEPTPYTDRLTLAESFSEDRETRPTAEDRRTYHTLLDGFVEIVVSIFRRPPR